MFKFIQYLRPLWYFNGLIKPNEKATYAQAYTNYLNIENGLITHLQSTGSCNGIVDNYTFILTEFGWMKLLKVFVLRGLTGSFFIIDLIPIFIVLFRGKMIVSIDTSKMSNFDSFNSNLLNQQPLVSVIIPTLNRYEYLKDVIFDLQKQTYQNFELFICDQTDKINLEFYSSSPIKVNLIKQKEQALWLARNRCIMESKGEYLLLFDDDSRVDEFWIENHLKCLDYFKCLASAGTTKTISGNPLSSRDLIFRLSDVFDTGNAMVHRCIFDKVGYFDRNFEKQRMGDGEFGNRLIKSGIAIISNPKANRIHLKVSVGGLRQMKAWDAFRTGSIFTPRPIPSVLYYARNYFSIKEILIFVLINLPFAYIPFNYKNSQLAKLLSIFVLPLTFPFLSLCLLKSVRLSNIMIQKGPQIHFPN